MKDLENDGLFGPNHGVAKKHEVERILKKLDEEIDLSMLSAENKEIIKPLRDGLRAKFGEGQTWTDTPTSVRQQAEDVKDEFTYLLEWQDEPQSTITADQLHQKMLRHAGGYAELSPDQQRSVLKPKLTESENDGIAKTHEVQRTLEILDEEIFHAQDEYTSQGSEPRRLMELARNILQNVYNSNNRDLKKFVDGYNVIVGKIFQEFGGKPPQQLEQLLNDKVGGFLRRIAL